VVAEDLWEGRCRLDRKWVSQPGTGLSFSVLLRTRAPIATWGWLPLLAGVALQHASADTGANTTLKWPNDLLAGPEGHKAAGVLAQTSGEAVVIGVGLNVSTPADQLPFPTATSLKQAGAREVDRADLLVSILTCLDARLVQWEGARGDAAACGLADAYRAVCATIGQHVRVTTMDHRAITGVATGLDPDGRLIVASADADGGEAVIGAGDVEHLRPA
jgi:BirA family biotin operon repressor/biotin-[acetyl-CoA-carboxylase] ligase